MLKRLVKWMDHDWEQRRYLSLFAFGQKLIWLAPLLVAAVLMVVAEAFGGSTTGAFTSSLLIIGLLGTFVMFSLSMYRWFVGYSRTEWQAKQAEKQRQRSKRN